MIRRVGGEETERKKEREREIKTLKYTVFNIR
jgi:hypothetical protein